MLRAALNSTVFSSLLKPLFIASTSLRALARGQQVVGEAECSSSGRILQSAFTQWPSLAQLLSCDEGRHSHPAHQLQAQRWATKKAGGTAKQKDKALPKNLGVKMCAERVT